MLVGVNAPKGQVCVRDSLMPATDPKLISGNANRELAAKIARRMTMHRGMSIGLCEARGERVTDCLLDHADAAYRAHAG